MEKKCGYCSTSFTCQRASRKYCSDNCKQMAYYKRNGFVLASTSSSVPSPTVSPINVKYGNTLHIQDILPSEKLGKLMTSIPFQDEPTALAGENDPIDLEPILPGFTVNGIDDNITPGTTENTSHANDNVLQSHPRLSPIKPSSLKYQWVESTFLQHVECHINDNNIDLVKYRHYTEYIKVLECFKCLTGVLIQLSNRSEINPDFFIKIAIAFSSLVQSKTFNTIPAYFPFISLIHELNEKLSIAAKNGGISKVYLSPKRKALLVSIRFIMGKDIKDLKLSEVIR